MMSESTAPAEILFVDDEREILSSLRRLLRPTGHKVHLANSGEEGLAMLGEKPIDLVVSDMRMPGMDGAQFLGRVAKEWPATVRMLLTGYADVASAVSAINDGAISRYLTKPWEESDLVISIEQSIANMRLLQEKERLEKLTAEQNTELKELNEGLERKIAERTRDIELGRSQIAEAHAALQSSYDATIEVFSRLIQSRTGLGSRVSVADDARAVGQQMGLDERATRALYDAALLCDIGKLSLPDDSVLTPYVRLDANAQREFHNHPAVAESTLLSLEPLAPAGAIIRSHTEHMDGTGYPDRKGAEEIPLESRILCVTKSFVDLQEGRVLDEKLTAKDARKFIVEHRDDWFDTEVVEHFERWLDNRKRDVSEVRERKLTLGQVNPGMRTTRDLCDPRGVVILAKGQRITESLLQRLVLLQESFDEPVVVHTEGS